MKIKILHILEAFVGGTRRHVCDLLLNLPHSEYEQELACSILREESCAVHVKQLEEKGIKVHILPMQRQISPLSDFFSLLKLTSIIKKNDYQIIHTHSSKAGFIGRIAAYLAGKTAVIHTPHVFPFQMQCHPFLRFFYVHLEKFASNFCKLIICVSEEEKKSALKNKVTSENKLLIIPNGIALSHQTGQSPTQIRSTLNIPNGGLLIGSVGRLSIQKGHIFLLEAIRILSSRFPLMRCLIAGNGELKEELIKKTYEFSIADKIIFSGHLYNIEDYYDAFDLAVFPSLWEGLPYAMLEAMRAGKAIVGSDVGGLGDTIRKEHIGMAVPPADPNALAEAITLMLVNHSHRNKCAENAFKAVKNYSIDKMIKEIETVYHKII